MQNKLAIRRYNIRYRYLICIHKFIDRNLSSGFLARAKRQLLKRSDIALRLIFKLINTFFFLRKRIHFIRIIITVTSRIIPILSGSLVPKTRIDMLILYYV